MFKYKRLAKPYGQTVKETGFLNSIKKEKNYCYEQLTSMVGVLIIEL